jgi:hypothetical protein
MRKAQWISAALLVVALAPLGWAQATKGPGNGRSAAAQAQRQTSQRKTNPQAQNQNSATTAGVQAGTRISAELLTTLDARKLRPGQQVVARVTKPVKQDGRTVIHKGARLLGRVTSVQATGQGEAGSQIGVQFDRLVQGHTVSQLNTVVTAVFSRPQPTPMGESEMQPPMAAPAPMSTGGGKRGGGLLGGAVSTVGSVAGSTVGTVDQTVGGVGGAVNASNQTSAAAGNRAGLGTPLAGVMVSSSAQAEQQTQASSMLSTRKGNLHLDSGTQMELQVTGQAQPQGSPPQPPRRR